MKRGHEHGSLAGGHRPSVELGDDLDPGADPLDLGRADEDARDRQILAASGAATASKLAGWRP